MPTAGSRQFVEQRLRFFQVGGAETLSKPAVDRCEKIAGFGAPGLLAPQPGEACGGAQFPELGPLLRGDGLGLLAAGS
jgi:hypothetical protein